MLLQGWLVRLGGSHTILIRCRPGLLIGRRRQLSVPPSPRISSSADPFSGCRSPGMPRHRIFGRGFDRPCLAKDHARPPSSFSLVVCSQPYRHLERVMLHALIRAIFGTGRGDLALKSQGANVPCRSEKRCLVFGVASSYLCSATI
jgi:hypothetical protein